MSNKINIQIILGSTREQRQGEKVANWIYALASKQKDFNIELIDLKDWPLPFFNEALSPAYLKGNYKEKLAKDWSKKIKKADAYIIVTPEYSHGYPAVLKNALDYLYEEWNNKPVAFVSYSGGPSAGIRAVEQLRQVVIELQMAPIREEINIPFVWKAFDEKGVLKDQEYYTKKAANLFSQLLWWAKALKATRTNNN